MKLSDTDKRELCARCGWVGRLAFQRDRHDLCEEPVKDSSSLETAVEKEEKKPHDVAKPRLSREVARRQGIPPKKTLAARRITQIELAAGRAELRALGGDDPYDRPKRRGNCEWCSVCQLVRDGESDGHDEKAQSVLEGPLKERPESFVCGHNAAEIPYRTRPCLFISCRYSLYLDRSETGSIIINFPHLEPAQMPADQSCALDLADRGPMTLEEVAVVTNLTRERIRQVEFKALTRRAKQAAMTLGLTAEDAAWLGTRHHVGPGADIEETGVEGAGPSEVTSLSAGSSEGDS